MILDAGKWFYFVLFCKSVLANVQRHNIPGFCHVLEEHKAFSQVMLFTRQQAQAVKSACRRFKI